VSEAIGSVLGSTVTTVVSARLVATWVAVMVTWVVVVTTGAAQTPEAGSIEPALALHTTASPSPPAEGSVKATAEAETTVGFAG
jgi:hypothetical protein